MVDELLTVIAVCSAIAGAIGSDLEEYWFNPGKFDRVKFARAVCLSIILSFGLVNIEMLTDAVMRIGYAGLVLMYVPIGYGIDKGRRDKVDRSQVLPDLIPEELDEK